MLENNNERREHAAAAMLTFNATFCPVNEISSVAEHIT